ncbi:MAG: MOSC domain-containing protein [Arenicellales bacterium]|jgi:MOSC domain-containing protein YiiM
MTETLQDLMDTMPQTGRVKWIGVRPARRAPVQILERVDADTSQGLVGDRYAGRSGGRHVTLIQWEHLPAVASVLGRESVDPALVRRNIAVAGINLLALKDRLFRIGDATLEFTDLCQPCSRMEEALGPGGYNAMRGHGGITARVVRSGAIALGDGVALLRQRPGA